MRKRLVAMLLVLMLAAPGVQAQSYQVYVLWQCTQYYWFLGWSVTGQYQVWTGGEDPAASGWMNFPYAWQCYPILTCYIGEGGSCGGMG